MAKKDKKRCSPSLIIREIQINITMSYHLTLVRMVIIKKSTNNNCWRGCGEKATFLHCWQESELLPPLWRRGGFSGGWVGEEFAWIGGDTGRHEFDSQVGKILQRRAWQSTPVFLPGESHGQRTWCTTFHEVTQSQTWLKQLSMHGELFRRSLRN